MSEFASYNAVKAVIQTAEKQGYTVVITGSEARLEGKKAPLISFSTARELFWFLEGERARKKK